jgi:hypothetical protein
MRTAFFFSFSVSGFRLKWKKRSQGLGLRLARAGSLAGSSCCSGWHSPRRWRQPQPPHLGVLQHVVGVVSVPSRLHCRGPNESLHFAPRQINRVFKKWTADLPPFKSAVFGFGDSEVAFEVAFQVATVLVACGACDTPTTKLVPNCHSLGG